jgi:hypothetical protein
MAIASTPNSRSQMNVEYYYPRGLHPLTGMPLLRSVPNHFESEQEVRCFRIFCEETAPQIGGPFKTSLWERLIPQTSDMVPFVRNAMVAIRALSKVSRDARKLQPNSPDGKGNHHLELKHQYALKQYDKALKGVRKAIADGQQDLRNALIACC